MKKIGVLLISLVLILSFAVSGCSSSKTTKSSDKTSKTVVTPDVKTIQDRGVLKVGVKIDVPKFGYKDPKTSKIDGFEIDLSKAIAKKILGDASKVQFEAVNAKTRGPLLDNGEVDMVAATFTITDQRKLVYNFSNPYFTDAVRLLVKKSAGYKNLKSLNGKTIGVAQSSTSKNAVQDEATKEGIKVNFLEFGTYPEIKSALDSGRVDCFSVDGAILMGYIDNTTELLPDKLTPQTYGIASKKGNDGLAKIANDTIKEMKANGDLNKLLTKWKIK